MKRHCSLLCQGLPLEANVHYQLVKIFRHAQYDLDFYFSDGPIFYFPLNSFIVLFIPAKPKDLISEMLLSKRSGNFCNSSSLHSPNT